MSASSASEHLDRLVAELGDWRGEMLQRIRRLMKQADPEMVMEWKWMGTPTWIHDGVVAIANPHKGKVKVTFAQGAKLLDPAGLFNAGLEGSLWRAIDLFEGDTLNEAAFRDLVRAGVAFNQSQRATKAAPSSGRRSNSPSKKRARA
jgi:hypothetical protein